MYSRTLLTTASALLVSQTLAATAGIGSGPGPHDNTTLFANANQHPNATGSIYLAAVNTTQDHFTLEPEEWHASINVTEVPWTMNQTVTNTVFSLQASEDFAQNSTTWDTCLIILTGVARNATVKGQNDNGDCKDTFGEDCVSKLTSALSLAGSTAGQNNQTVCAGLALPNIPTECQGSLSWDSFQTTITSNQTTGKGAFYSATDPHDVSNTTYYESAATRIWPLVLIQSSVRADKGGTTSAKMSCLRASNATTGSEKIGDVPGAADHLHKSSWLLLGALGLLGWFV